MIRVGKCHYQNGKMICPSYNNYTNIVVMLKSSSKYWPLSPYYLLDEQGRIMENIYQFSKVYGYIPNSLQYKSQYDRTIIWNHPAENHFVNGQVTNEYLNWSNKGKRAKDAIRYPVGFKHRHNCLFALAENDDGVIDISNQLNYIDTRKKIYVKEYCRLSKQIDIFKELKTRLDNGENLMIVEIDGPREKSMSYYKQKYGVADDFIQNDSMEVNQKNIQIMLNDPKHPFGHGYCLAMSLLDKDIAWNV